MDKWDRILSESSILLALQARRKFGAIRELAGVLDKGGIIGDRKQFIAELIRREKQSSTGIGKGVAVPHAHEDSIRRQALAVGISHQGIDFGAPDGGSVHIVALLATPRKHQAQHMDLLAALSRLLQHEEVRRRLIEAADVAEVIEIFKTAGA